VSASSSCEVAESEGVTAQCFDAAVDRFGGPFEAWWSKNTRMSSRRRHKVRPSCAILSNLAGTAWRIESIARSSPLCRAGVRVGVGGDDLLIDQPGDFDREVLFGVENGAQPYWRVESSYRRVRAIRRIP
jgi:hypothetical protein